MHKMKLLVAYDGSDCARLALDDLRNAGLPSNLHATVVSVADMICLPAEVTDAGPDRPDWLARALERARSERHAAVERMRSVAEAGADRLREGFPGWTVESEVHCDSPAWGVIKRANELDSDLIVLGSQGSSAFGRLFLGSTSLKVLNTASCSVRIARSPRRDRQTGLRLLLAIDGSSDSHVAVCSVKARHWPPRTLVRVVSALDAFMSTAVVSQRDDIKRWVQEATEHETWVHRMVAAVALELREAGLEVEAAVVPGEPKQVLVDEAERWKADGVFLGSQGLNAVERLVLGSVSSAVAARVPCSVEVARRAPGRR